MSGVLQTIRLIGYGSLRFDFSFSRNKLIYYNIYTPSYTYYYPYYIHIKLVKKQHHCRASSNRGQQCRMAALLAPHL